MNTSVGLGTVVSNSLANLSFFEFTLVGAVVVMAIMWCLVPLAVFSMRWRMDDIEAAVGEQTSRLSSLMSRNNDLILTQMTLSATQGDRLPEHNSSDWRVNEGTPVEAPGHQAAAYQAAGYDPAGYGHDQGGHGAAHADQADQAAHPVHGMNEEAHRRLAGRDILATAAEQRTAGMRDQLVRASMR